jgi:ABC-type amino acid transport substrate-binding protein
MTADDMKWLAEAKGVPLTDFTRHIEALSMDGYIAFSLNTPATLVQQWQSSLNAMKADGTFEVIRKKWFGE